MNKMDVFICGNFTNEKKKPCKYCINYFLWGISVGTCMKFNEYRNCNYHCKYFKRDSEIWSKDGECKIDENELYT